VLQHVHFCICVTVHVSVIGDVTVLPDVLVGISKFGSAETQLGF